MKVLILIVLIMLSFNAHAGTPDTCANSGNVLWKGMLTYKGPPDREARISDVINSGALYADNALTVAVWFGYDDIIERLINTPNVLTKYGAQSLYLAASMGRIREMSILLNAGVMPNAETSGGFTPIYGAAEHGCIKAMSLLIHHGADINHRADVQWTLLEDAVVSKQIKAARFLIDHGYHTSGGEERRVKAILHRMNMDSKFSYIFGSKYPPAEPGALEM